MANILAKNKAKVLRKKGRSISEIARKLNVPKSTVGVWCRNIKLGRKQIERLEKLQRSGSYKGRMIFLERLRSRRLQESKLLQEEGVKEIGIINKRDLFISGLSFYISEGSTSEFNEEVSFTNSDYRAILLMKKWFKEICGISDDRFAVQIRINNIYKNKVIEAEKYWSRMLKIDLSQFTKTILIKSKLNKIYPKNSIYYGTVRLKIKKGTKVRRKINGWVKGLLENKMPA